MGPRLFFILGIVIVVLMVFSMIDVILTDRRRVRALNKPAWFFIVILPVIGPALWFFLGKERGDRGDRGGETRKLAPDDDPAFFKTLQRDSDQDERIRRLEQELAELDDDNPPKD
jgi:hypothetical protein